MDTLFNFFDALSTNEILKQNALNNADLAYLTIISLCIFILSILYIDIFGARFKNTIKIIFDTEIIFIVFLLIIWVTLICYVLKKIGIWNLGLIKDTIIWFITTGIFIVFKVIPFDKFKIKHDLISILFKAFGISSVARIIFNKYIFSYWIELIIIFLAIVIIIIVEVSLPKVIDKCENRLKSPHKILIIVVIILAILLIYIFNIKEIIDDFKFNFSLTLSMIIPTYLLGIYDGYSKIFRKLKFRGNLDKKTKRYVRLKIILYAKLNYKKLDNKYYERIFWLSDKKEIKKAFKDLKLIKY